MLHLRAVPGHRDLLLGEEQHPPREHRSINRSPSVRAPMADASGGHGPVSVSGFATPPPYPTVTLSATVD